MTNNPADKQSVPPPDRPPQPSQMTKPSSIWQRAATVLQVVLSLAIAGTVLAYLIWAGTTNGSTDDEKRPTRPEEVVQVIGPRLIRVRAGTPLDSKLQLASVEAVWLTAPVLPVTGTTLASLRSGKGEAQDAWQFATSDLLTAFSDWQKAVIDVQFQMILLSAIRELAEYRVVAQKSVVERMEKLVDAGTDTVKDLMVERVNLKQFEIQGKREVHEGENALKVAQKTEATLARQLQQAGLEPTMLHAAATEGEIVVAEVPERAVERVKLGMTCQVRFFALPDRVFTGTVSSISPFISKEKRALNVQFVVKDPEKIVRPGMFAEIGLGTDKRQALLMPADGVLHVGERDYALVAGEPGAWQVKEVQVGELRGTKIEVLSGLKTGDRVLGQGAILLKPTVVLALQATSPAASDVKVSDGPGGKSR
jgi:membrane fusion protein, heavy metal efflux system